MSQPKCSLLVVDDESYILPPLAILLSDQFNVVTADSAAAAEEVFARQQIDLVLTDQNMPRKTGVQLLEWVRHHHPRTVRLLMTGYGEMQDAIDAINRGNVYYYLIKPWRIDDLKAILKNAAEKFHLERSRDELLTKLQQARDDLEKRVVERTKELQESNHLLEQRSRELDRLAKTDPLTGLLNVRAMEEIAEFELKRHLRYPGSLTFGIVDVDHFKSINTRYTHLGGNSVLCSLTRVLKASLREVDTVGRVGGEEFLIVAPETDEEGAVGLAERVRSAVESAVIGYGNQSISVTVSLGMAVAEAGVAVDYEMLYGAAARALVLAKANGRNRYEILQVGSSTPAAT